jgi:hypothetical protein
MTSSRSHARSCRCARPIRYRDPGEPAACAKCGHLLDGRAVSQAAADPDPTTDGAENPSARRWDQELPADAGASSRSLRRGFQALDLPPTPTVSTIEWPFAPSAGTPHSPADPADAR